MINSCVYQQSRFAKTKFDETRCNYAIWRKPEDYQCARKARHSVGGYDFCKHHAEKLAKRFGLDIL